MASTTEIKTLQAQVNRFVSRGITPLVVDGVVGAKTLLETQRVLKYLDFLGGVGPSSYTREITSTSALSSQAGEVGRYIKVLADSYKIPAAKPIPATTVTTSSTRSPGTPGPSGGFPWWLAIGGVVLAVMLIGRK